MFKLGEYGEEEAKSIADSLRIAGIRVDLRPSIGATIETEDFLQGRFSELRADIKETDLIENYERYLNALRVTLLAKPSAETFEQEFLSKLFPSLDEKRKKVRELLEDIPKGPGEDDGKPEGRREADSSKQTVETMNPPECSEESANTSEEEVLNKAREVLFDLTELIAEGIRARDFARRVLSLNDIEIGDEVGELLDDPIADIPVDLDDYGRDHPRARRILYVYLGKCYDLYVDEFSVVFADMFNDEFIQDHPDENIKLGSLRLLLADMMENRSSDKMNFQTFEDECRFTADEGKRILKVFGYSVAGEIARALEKNGMIKIKGDIIKWKR